MSETIKSTFKHWKEAETRANELKERVATLKAEIGEMETEARSENVDVERRDELIELITESVETRDKAQEELNAALIVKAELRKREEDQIGLLPNLTTERITSRVRVRDEQEKRAEVIATRNYELAWADYVRTGNETVVRNLLNTQTSTTGGVLVPKALADKIEDAVMKGGQILNLCGVMQAKGLTEYPVVNTKSDPELHNETGSTPKKEKDITFSSVAIDAQYIAEILTVSKKFETDAVEIFWEWLMRELPDAAKRVIDKKILTGGQASSDGIHGILTNANADFVAALTMPSVDWNVANAAMAVLSDAATNITFLMNPGTFFNSFRGLAGADGHPIFVEMTQNAQTPGYQIGGYKVITTNYLPSFDAATTGDTYMVAGDFSAMLLNFPEGASPKVTRDPFTKKHNNQVDYLSEIYVGGNIVRLGSFVKVTK